MAFALKLKKVDKSEMNRRVEEAASVLGIEHFLDRKPKALSGGQRQRVALGRAIVREPKAFLMDEPLSNLDAKLRVNMRTEISKLHNRIGVTTIYVTHDQTEAMTMADRIVVLKDGKVQQVDSPQQMYDHPKNVFVAGFIGSPAMNFIRAKLEKQNDGMVVTFGNTRLPITREMIGKAKEEGQDPEKYAGGEVVLGIRPEHIEDAKFDENEGDGDNTVEVEPQVIESMGSEKYLYFEVGADQAAHLESMESMTDVGDEEGGSPEGSGDMMVARVAAESEARMGEKMLLTMDASKVRLFDPKSEKAVL
jgi:multiple sugar transport system ATP-binding protein